MHYTIFLLAKSMYKTSRRQKAVNELLIRCMGNDMLCSSTQLNFITFSFKQKLEGFILGS